MNNNSNIYQKAIEALVEEGHTILQVFNQDNSCFYFSVLEFQESFVSPTNSVDFNAVKGINITDFMQNHGGNPNVIILKSKFNEYIINAPVIRCEFDKHTRWMKWGSATR